MTTFTPSKYLMNNIPRGTSPNSLLRSLADLWRIDPNSHLCHEFILQIMEEPTIQDSQLDDALSVAIVQFKPGQTPTWFKMLDRDPHAFPKVAALGSIWGGVELADVDDNMQNAFCRAVVAGDLVYAETLAEFAETDVNCQDRSGRTALHWACANRLVEMTEFLLSIPKIDTGLRDAEGLTAFDIACQHIDPRVEDPENESIPKLFYRSMFQLDRSDPDGALLQLLTVTSEPDEGGPVYPGEALFRPAVANNLPLVKALMEFGVDLAATNEEGETALHLAAKAGNTAIVNAMVANSSRGMKFDLEAVAKHGLTALHYAAAGGHQETVEELLGQGADPTARDSIGQTPFDWAVLNRHTGIQQVLSGAGIDDSVEPVGVQTEADRLECLNKALFKAVSGSRTDELLSVIDQGGDVNASGNDTNSPLQRAVVLGNTAVVQILLDGGANADGHPKAIFSPLYYVLEMSHLEMFKLLLDKGANIEGSPRAPVTPLQAAAGVGNLDIVRLLLDRGANTKPCKLGAPSPLLLAASSGDRKMVKLLLQGGAAPLGKSGKESTTLMKAASGYPEQMADLLDGRLGARDLVELATSAHARRKAKV